MKSMPIIVKYLGKKTIIKDIDDINEKESEQSIIILDALDENAEATKDRQGFIQRLEEVADKFKIVIITCRTQFFPDEVSEPIKWLTPNNGLKNKSIYFEKFYISPISNEEARLYLERKFRLGTSNYRKALELYQKCQDLTSRPIILQYIEDLLPLYNKYVSTVEIYINIINAWFQREIEIQPYLSNQDLWFFSKNLAYFIYDNWQITNGDLFISEYQYNNFIHHFNYKDSPYSFKVRSLINRKDDGTIKFAHTSFWEFFIAVFAFENPGLSFNNKGLDLAASFFKEIYKLSINGELSPYIKFFEPNYLSPNNYNDVFCEAYKKQLRCVIDLMSENPINSLEKEILPLLYDIWEKMVQIQQFVVRVAVSITDYLRGSSPDYDDFSEKCTSAMADYKLLIERMPECFIDINNITAERLNNYLNKFENLIQFKNYLDNLLDNCFVLCGNNRMHNLKEELKDLFIKKPVKQTLIFPELLNILGGEEFKEMFKKNLLYFGSGFCDKSVLYDILKRNTTGYATTCCLIKECDNLDELVNYINSFTQIIEVIWLRIIYKGTTICFCISSVTKSLNFVQIKNMLCNMIKAKSILNS